MDTGLGLGARRASSLCGYALFPQEVHQLLVLFDSKLMHLPGRLDGVKNMLNIHSRRSDSGTSIINVMDVFRPPRKQMRVGVTPRIPEKAP